MEVRQHVKFVQVRMICDKCNEGEMKYTGTTLECYPPLFIHMCTGCRNRENYTTTYPHIEQDVSHLVL